MIQFLQEAAHVVPSKRQLDWYELESYAFIHFGVNTFTNREWGEGTEPESIFNPENPNLMPPLLHASAASRTTSFLHGLFFTECSVYLEGQRQKPS